MPEFSGMTPLMRVEARIAVPRHALDHRVAGRPVMPAVESMVLLAAAAMEAGLEPADMRDADFPRFLALDPDREVLEGIFEQAIVWEGMRIAFLTRSIMGRSGLSRLREHAAATFGAPPEPLPEPPEPSELTDVFVFPAPAAYRDLVPFGPAYQNLQGDLRLWPQGAEGLVRAPDTGVPDGPLGSPFPLDAAFHLAAAWGARHAGRMMIPLGFGHRRVQTPTRPGVTYRARVLPRGIAAGLLSADVWLTDETGKVMETVLGLRMGGAPGLGPVPEGILL